MFVHMFTFDLHHSQHKYHALFFVCVCICVYVRAHVRVCVF